MPARGSKKCKECGKFRSKLMETGVCVLCISGRSHTPELPDFSVLYPEPVEYTQPEPPPLRPRGVQLIDPESEYWEAVKRTQQVGRI